MYTPTYGYSPGNPSSSQYQNGSSQPPHQQPPSHNPQQQQQRQQQPPHHPHLQQQHSSQTPQTPGQQPQHMMYNAQAPSQYQQQPIGGIHQSPYGASGPSMGGNAGGMGMMQNNGMAHMAGPHAVPSYQTPYSGSPYGASIPTSSPANMLPNYMPTTSSAPSFPMNATNMNMNPQQQHQAQRMQPPSSASTPTPGQRGSPFGGMPLGTPPNTSTAQSQFPTPQNPGPTMLQTPSNQQNQGAGHGGTILTPQTPNFPPGSQSASAGNSLASPLSPGSQSKEKERVSLLLDINTELLMEVMYLQVLQAEQKKDMSKDTTSPEGAAEKEKSQKLKELSQEYVECMKRLQSNLAYLAAIADRSHKPSSQIPAHPAIMLAPSIKPRTTNSVSSSSPKTEDKADGMEDKKPDTSDAERIETLKDYYKQLQALFPGVDPNKEPVLPQPNAAARTQAQQMAAQQAQAQQMASQHGGQSNPMAGKQIQMPGQVGGPVQGQSQGSDLNQQQQKMQQEMLRQKMMQQAQQQHGQNQHQMGQGMQGMQGMNPQQPRNR